MDALLKALEAIVGAANVLADPASLLACSRTAPPAADAPLPVACVRPTKTAQVGQILHLCGQVGQSISFRGGGTSWTQRAAVIILTDGLNRIYEVNVRERTLTAQPGVRCVEAAAAAAREGLYLPGLPLSESVATLGGALANNAAGPGAAHWGFLGDRVLRLDLWLTSGHRLQCFGARGLPGDLYGAFPMAHLFCGSRGRLAFLGDMVLRLEAVPPFRASILLTGPWDRVATAATMLTDLPLAELYMVNDQAALALGYDKGAYLYLEALSEATARAARAIASECRLNDVPEVTDFLEGRSGLFPTLYGQNPQGVQQTFTFPPSRLEKFLEAVADVEAPVALAGDVLLGRMRVSLMRDSAGGGQPLQPLEAVELMLNESLRDEGDATLSRSQWLQKYGQPQRVLDRQLQQIFDPVGILPTLEGGDVV